MSSRAVILKEFGSLDGIEIEDCELESLGDGMIQVQVHYCGINFADFYTIHGLADVQLPKVLGIECSGIVTDIGNYSLPFKIGDKVVCYNYKGGLHKSVVRIHHEHCYKLPDFVDLQSGAAIFVNYLTAWFALFSIGNLKDNDSVFVSSCAGGVGLAILELTKSKKNVSIYGSASSGKREFLESKGVNFVDYDEIATLNHKFDMVIESVSTETRKLLSSKLNPFGTMVIIGAKNMLNSTDEPVNPDINPVDLIYNNSIVGGLHLGLIADRHPDIMSKALDAIFFNFNPKNLILKTYLFNDAKLAYEILQSRTSVGKILLQLL